VTSGVGMLSPTAALTLVVLIAHLALCCAVDCQYSAYDQNGNYVSYDLRPLVSPSTYIFRAKIGSYHYRYHGQQYDYLINVCDDVHPDAKHTACNELAHAPAFQVTAPPAPTPPPTGKYTPPPPPPYEAECYRIADSGNVKFNFINESDPEEGVMVAYRGGQRCRKRNTPEVIKTTNETWTDVERVVELKLQCDREMGQNSETAVTDLINSGATIQVEEKSPPDECQYVITWRTPHACPYGSGYAKVVAADVPAAAMQTANSGGGGGGWVWWIFKMSVICGSVLTVVVLVLCLPVVKKRITQYQRGDFNSFGDFLSYLFGDIHVRIRQLSSGGGGGLPTNRHSLGHGHHHEHTV